MQLIFYYFVIRYTKWQLVLIGLLGVFLSHFSVFIRFLEKTDTVCRTITCFDILSSSILLSVLFMKIWRVSKLLYEGRKLKKYNINDNYLYKGVATLVFAQVVYLTVWLLSDPSKAVSSTYSRVNSDGVSLEVDFMVCTPSGNKIYIFDNFFFIRPALFPVS